MISWWERGGEGWVSLPHLSPSSVCVCSRFSWTHHVNSITQMSMNILSSLDVPKCFIIYGLGRCWQPWPFPLACKTRPEIDLFNALWQEKLGPPVGNMHRLDKGKEKAEKSERRILFFTGDKRDEAFLDMGWTAHTPFCTIKAPKNYASEPRVGGGR